MDGDALSSPQGLPLSLLALVGGGWGKGSAHAIFSTLPPSPGQLRGPGPQGEGRRSFKEGPGVTNSLNLLSDLISRARAAGADAADAVLVAGTSLGVSRRLGQTEHVERAEGRDLGLRVFLGRRAAIVSDTAIDPSRFTALAERAVAMARVVPEDPFTGLADTAAPPRALDLDLDDPGEPTAEALVARAAAAEDAAMAVPGVTNSEGAEAGFSRAEAVLVTSAGFAGRTTRTSHSVSAAALAGSGTAMQRDYDSHGTVHLADLDDPAKIGRSAGERAVARLNPARPEDRQVAGDLRSARLRRLARPPGGGDQRRRRGAWHQLPEGQARPAHFRLRDRDPRRSAASARPALPPVRRRGHAHRNPRPDRRRRADDVAAGQPVRAPAWHGLHRTCVARHRRTAVAVAHQPVSGRR